MQLLDIHSKHWHAIYVSSRQEKKVSEKLVSKGIEAYLPMVKTIRQWSDRKKRVELPLINGYVFVHISSQEYEHIYETKGFVNFVKADGKIAIIRDLEIIRMKQLVDLGYQMDSQGISHSYQKGDRIRIVAGPLKDFEGYILEENGTKRLEILVESIGYSIKVTIPKEIISLTEPIHSATCVA